MRRSEHPLPPPWGEHDIPPDDTVSIDVGPLILWFRARRDEIWVASKPGNRSRELEEAATRTPEDQDWVRWPVSGGADRISLSPMLPPRSVVVEPELAFRLLPRTEARIFVRVPLWVNVELASEPPAALAEIPSLILSDTWWGGFTEGELCYWLPTTARRHVETEVFSPHLVVCPLQLHNDSDEELQVEEIALRVAHLTGFSDAGRFWADETRVRYRGDGEGSDIEMSGEPPREASSAVEVAVPRSPLPRGFRARSFARLKTLPGLAGL